MLSGTSATLCLFHAQILSVQTIIRKFWLRPSIIIIKIIIVMTLFYYNLIISYSSHKNTSDVTLKS